MLLAHRVVSSFYDGDQVTLLNDVTFGNGQFGDPTGALGEDGNFHLHGFEDHEDIALVDPVALDHDDSPHVPDRLGTYLLEHMPS